jgi:hypothetical protein
MMDDNSKEISSFISSFKDIVLKLKIDIHNDSEWPLIAENLIKDKDLNFRLLFWHKLDSYFKKTEKRTGHCHKGQIYWRISEIYLLNGETNRCIKNLEKSRKDDILRNPNQFTASQGFLSVIKPLFYRYKDKHNAIKFDLQVNQFYNTFNQNEKLGFGNMMLFAHNASAQRAINSINNNYFNFITHRQNRAILFKTYCEIRSILLGTNLQSHYSSIFGIGSILESMLDNLFQRNDEALWKLFKKIVPEKNIASSKMKSDAYDDGMTLSQKVMALRLMANENKQPIPKEIILLMLIISEYRDLIHPRRRLKFKFDANWYVAFTLCTFISQIAHYWWPSYLNRRIKELIVA